MYPACANHLDLSTGRYVQFSQSVADRFTNVLYELTEAWRSGKLFTLLLCLFIEDLSEGKRLMSLGRMKEQDSRVL